MKKLILTGSIAYDYLMQFPGRFRDHILPDHLDHISLSFLVDTMIRRRGGVAANIAYTLALLGEHPTIMATVGEDFDEYQNWLNQHGVDTSAIQTINGLNTASFFVNTDLTNAQIASFYPGAMARANELHFSDLQEKPDLAMISPNDPDAMNAYVEECRRLKIPFIYDPSQQIVRLTPDDLRTGIEGCKALFTNDYEFELIKDKTGLDLEAIRDKAEFVVITRGEEGADIYTRDSDSHIPSIPPKEIVEPTGVGDAFRAGFLKGYLHNLSYERCGQIGALAATYCLEHDGPQGHQFNLTNFINRFREHFDDQCELDQLL